MQAKVCKKTKQNVENFYQKIVKKRLKISFEPLFSPKINKKRQKTPKNDFHRL